MKYLLFLLITLPFLRIHAQDIDIIKATGQKRYGGIAGSGSTTIYKIDLLVPKTNFKEDGLWIKKTFLRNYIRNIKHGDIKDTLLLTLYYQNPPENKTQSIAPVKIQYRKRKKRKFFLIEKIEPLPSEYMP